MVVIQGKGEHTGVAPTLEQISEELARYDVLNEKANLGCRVKYPIDRVLEGIQRFRKKFSNIRFLPREDAYVFDTDGRIRVTRFESSLHGISYGGGYGELGRLIYDIHPVGVVALFSFPPGSSCVDDFEGLANPFLYQVHERGIPIEIGKGHTITPLDGEPGFGVLDFIETHPGKLNGVANNDTIVDIDCKLPSSSWITVYTALNNALNDVFALGVYEDLYFYPTFGGDEATIEALSKSYDRYLSDFARVQHISHRMNPKPTRILGWRKGLVGWFSEGYTARVVGATVIGTTDREVPRHANLSEGQILFATRPIGDLAPLAQYMASAYEAQAYRDMNKPERIDNERLKHLEELRLKVLQYLVTSNMEAAYVISRYLPKKGHRFKADKHITATIDVSGPGLKTVEWLVEDSGYNIHVSDVRYHDPSIPEISSGLDPTAGTNGAIIMAARSNVAEKVMEDLRSFGYEPWVLGEVKAKSKNPRVTISNGIKLPSGYFGGS